MRTAIVICGQSSETHTHRCCKKHPAFFWGSRRIKSVRWHMPVMPALRRRRQEDQRWQVWRQSSLTYTKGWCLKENNKRSLIRSKVFGWVHNKRMRNTTKSKHYKEQVLGMKNWDTKATEQWRDANSIPKPNEIICTTTKQCNSWGKNSHPNVNFLSLAFSKLK